MRIYVCVHFDCISWCKSVSSENERVCVYMYVGMDVSAYCRIDKNGTKPTNELNTASAHGPTHENALVRRSCNIHCLSTTLIANAA